MSTGRYMYGKINSQEKSILYYFLMRFILCKIGFSLLDLITGFSISEEASKLPNCKM